MRQRVAMMLAAGLVSLAILGAPRDAWADDAAAEDGTPVGVELDAYLFLDGRNGYHLVGSPQETFALGVGGAASVRWGLIRAGAFVDAEGSVYDPGSVHAGGFVGPTLVPRPWLRLDVVAELGANYVFGLGEDLFVSETRGETSATLPFAGARLSVAWRFGPRHGGTLGGWLGFRDDLTRLGRYPEVTTCFIGCSTSAEAWSIGGASILAGVRVGYEL